MSQQCIIELQTKFLFKWFNLEEAIEACKNKKVPCIFALIALKAHGQLQIRFRTDIYRGELEHVAKIIDQVNLHLAENLNAPVVDPQLLLDAEIMEYRITHRNGRWVKKRLLLKPKLLWEPVTIKTPN